MKPKRWLVILACLVAPSLAHAEGWLLMIPPTTPVELPPNVLFTEAWSNAYAAQTQTDIRAPLVQWEQHRAFDSAHACEYELFSIRHREIDTLNDYARRSGSWHADFAARIQVLQIAEIKRLDHARCLPASQVPVR
jgi:hypothetical protein